MKTFPQVWPWERGPIPAALTAGLTVHWERSPLKEGERVSWWSDDDSPYIIDRVWQRYCTVATSFWPCSVPVFCLPWLRVHPQILLSKQKQTHKNLNSVCLMDSTKKERKKGGGMVIIVQFDYVDNILVQLGGVSCTMPRGDQELLLGLCSGILSGQCSLNCMCYWRVNRGHRGTRQVH